MADNTTLDSGTGGDTIRTEDRTTFKTPVSLIDVGGVSAEALIGDAGNYMPVAGAAAENAAVAGNPILVGARYDATPRTLGDGDVGALAISAGGQALVQVSDGTNTLDLIDLTGLGVYGTGVKIYGGQRAVLSDDGGMHSTPGTGYVYTAGYPSYYNGTGWDRVRGNKTDGLLVNLGTNNDITGTVTANLSATDNAVLDSISASVAGTLTVASHNVTNAGTFAVQSTLQAGTNSIGKLAANSGVDIGDVDVLSLPNVTIGTWSAGALTVDLGANNDVQGDVAHDAADSGNPLKIGAKVETATSGATLAADGDRTDLYADSDGTLIQRVNHPLADLLVERTSNTDGAATAFTGDFAASGASIKNYVTAISIHNSSATDGYVDFRDGAAGSVLWTVPIPAGGGLVVSNGGHPLFATTANTALAFDVSAALSTVYISVSGFKSKV